MLEYKYMNSDSVDSKDLKKIGSLVKTVREKLGMTQADVAKKSNMTVNYYAMIERGEVNPTYDKMKSLTKTLKLKITIS